MYFTQNPILEMALKSFIISKLDHLMSKSWKWIAAHAFETTNKFDKLKKLSTWLLSSGQDFGKKILDSKHDMSSRCISSPAGKIQIFIFTTSLWACLAENSPLNEGEHLNLEGGMYYILSSQVKKYKYGYNCGQVLIKLPCSVYDGVLWRVTERKKGHAVSINRSIVAKPLRLCKACKLFATFYSTQ